MTFDVSRVTYDPNAFQSEAATSLPPPPSEEANARAEQHYGPLAEFTHVDIAKGKL